MEHATETTGATLGEAAFALEPDWWSGLARRQNVLLEGPRPLTEACLARLEPNLLKPVRRRRLGAPLELRSDHNGALILEDVASLDRQQQGDLSRWLDEATGRRQIVSMTTTPLFSLVEGGLFDPRLYYRLNVILLRL